MPVVLLEVNLLDPVTLARLGPRRTMSKNAGSTRVRRMDWVLVPRLAPHENKVDQSASLAVANGDPPGAHLLVASTSAPLRMRWICGSLS